MANDRAVGRIFFSDPVQATIFEHELKGLLLSDHWAGSSASEFWCNLDARIITDDSSPRVETDDTLAVFARAEIRFVIAELHSSYHDAGRMLALGRMARALEAAGKFKRVPLISFSSCVLLEAPLLLASAHMPATLDMWKRSRATNTWKSHLVASFMEPVSPELAEAFYAVTYKDVELRCDLYGIERAMKNIVPAENDPDDQVQAMSMGERLGILAQDHHDDVMVPGERFVVRLPGDDYVEVDLLVGCITVRFAGQTVLVPASSPAARKL
jgi:hypothetical protein